MNKRVIAIVVSVLLLAAIVGVLVINKPAEAPSGTSNTSTNTSGEQQATANPVATDKIDIKDFAFAPGSVTVKKGTTVTWVNQDTTKHTVTPDDETSDFKSSELLAKGESYSVTFNTAGSFTYHCAPHPNMTATVVVTD
jgi:plastocyanin